MSPNQVMYDELPRTCRAMSYAHPNRLATIARLFGLEPPAVATCRVLELGCCDGSHLISIADGLPESYCVGIDKSERFITKGQAAIQSLKLNNISLKSLDILQSDESIGQFDYIIAHGIYSWVSPEVQHKILSICKQQLAPNGVAYVSYDTYPGWKIRDTIRDMMRYHTSQLPKSSESFQPLRALLKLFTDASQLGETPYSRFLADELSRFSQLPDSFSLSEFLEENNNPLYFHEFVNQARLHELDYLGDAFVHTMVVEDFPVSISTVLQGLKFNLIHQEQMMDFLHNCHFRHTLLCHGGTEFKRTLLPKVVEDFYIASSLQPIENTDDKSTQQFANQKGNVTTKEAAVQAMFHYLWQQWPNKIAFKELVVQVNQVVGFELNKTEWDTMANVLLNCYLKDLVEFHSYPLHYVAQVSEYPQASRLVRWQVEQGFHQVTNLQGDTIELENALSIRLIPLLDGQHHLSNLLNKLEKWIQQGDLKLDVRPPTGQSSPVLLDAQQTREILTTVLNGTLQVLANRALLQNN